MIFTEQDIENMAICCIKHLMNEYHQGQQLNIPFDGNSSEPVNYEQFIEYLETIGDYGTLPEPKQYDILYNPEITSMAGEGAFYLGTGDELDEYYFADFVNKFKNFYKNQTNIWIDNQPVEDDDVMNLWPQELRETYLTPYGQQCWDKLVMEKGKDNLTYLLDKMIFNDEGQIYCERLITIPSLNDRYKEYYSDSEQEWTLDNKNIAPNAKERDLYNVLVSDYGDNIGCYWSYAKGGGYKYFDGFNGEAIILRGWVNPEDVNWEMTAQLDTMDEQELRLEPNVLVQVDEIVTDYKKQKLPLKGSILLKT